LGKYLKTPPKHAKRKEIEGQAILTSKLPIMDTQKKKKQKNEVNTKTLKATKQRQSQREKGKNQKLTTDSKGKEKGDRGKGKRETYLEKMQRKLEKENHRNKVGA